MTVDQDVVSWHVGGRSRVWETEMVRAVGEGGEDDLAVKGPCSLDMIVDLWTWGHGKHRWCGQVGAQGQVGWEGKAVWVGRGRCVRTL